MDPLAFAFPVPGGVSAFAKSLVQAVPCETGEWECRRFPDGETYVRYLTPVKDRDVVLICALDNPDGKIMPVYLAAKTAHELGARRVGLVIPYLPYMRQDARFQEGEGITSRHFAALISSCCDWLVTVDPHLHRHHDMDEIYTVPSRVVHAAPAIAAWISSNVPRPIVIGPDEESGQWVRDVADLAGCPYLVLKKTRHGDRDVEVSEPVLPDGDALQPVILDDIVSTGSTMVTAIEELQRRSRRQPVCIAVHPLLVEDAYAALLTAGIGRLVSCNTVVHRTNRIDLAPSVAKAVLALLEELRTGMPLPP